MLRLAALCLLVFAGPIAAGERVHAVLVGVSDYLYLDADLKGPRNDVLLMRAVLEHRGVPPRAIRTLSADGETPTRAAILGALDALVGGVGLGDTVFFYFSGHGTQAPDADGDEQGGYDEVFLPADARGWSGAAQAVENGITDDEFRARAEAILSKGARLVVVIDACHSATGFRALSSTGVARTLAPEALGIPGALANGGTAPPPLAGDFVFLYAAQSDERAFEYPQGPPADAATWHGDFTLALAQVLRAVPDLSWEQAMQAARAGLRQGQATQTPDAEGPALTAPVFGSATPPARRIAYDGNTLKAGVLDGLDTGAELALYADAVATDPVARARVEAVKMRSATFELSDGATPQQGYAVVTAPGVPPVVRFGVPERADPTDGQDYELLLSELAMLSEQHLLDGAEFGVPDPDIGLVLVEGRLALTGRDGILDPHGQGTSPRILPGDLFDGLDRALRVHRLRAALARSGKPGLGVGLLATAGLRVDLGHRRGKARSGGCARQAGPETRPISENHTVAPCDQLWLHLKNTSLKARDVTVLYVDSDNRVSALWPSGNLSNRLLFNEETTIGVQIVSGNSEAGREEVIVISVPAETGAPRTVLTALSDSAPSRAASGNAAAQYLLTAADPSATSRSFSFATAPVPVEVTRFGVLYQSIHQPEN